MEKPPKIDNPEIREIVIYKIKIPLGDQIEGLPTKLNKFLIAQNYEFEIIDSKGFEE